RQPPGARRGALRGRLVRRPGPEHERRRVGGRRVVTASLDLSRHLRAARRALLYLVAGVAEGLLNLVLVGGGLLLGLLLAPIWVGLPLLAGTGRLALRLAERERRQANRLLDAHLPPVP